MAAAKQNKAANKRSAGPRSAASRAAGSKNTRKNTSNKASSEKPSPAKKTVSKKTAPKKATSKGATSKKAAKKDAAPKKAAAPKKTASKKAGKKGGGKKATPKKAAPKKKGLDATEKAPKVRRASRAKLAESVPPPPPSSKRNFGLRGAAPWVARHAAKHAEELRKRNAEPPPPGSARATLRTPKEAEQIKSKVGELHQLSSQIRQLRKKLDKSFYEIGLLLAEVQRLELHEAKGYSSFESFLDREVDLPRSVSLRLIRISHTFQRETAYDFGLERLGTALAALDGEITQAAPSHPSSRGWSSAGIPVKPPIRFDE